MDPRRHRLTATLIVALATFMALPAADSFADSVASTDQATSIRSTSAVLNGHATPPSTSSAWFFQYGAAGAKQLSTTKPRLFKSTNPQSVSLRVGALTPARTYFFRLVVETPQTESTQFNYGSVRSFTTPDGIATTGDATSVTERTAVLNGVVNVSDPDSAWFFQYGPTKSYGKLTRVQPVGAGLTVVSAKVVGLTPGRGYHYRLVVIEGSYPRQVDVGADRGFRTKLYGKLSLRRRSYRVRHGRVQIPVRCSGAPGASCRGRLTITVTGATGSSIRCASSRFALRAGAAPVLRRSVRGACRTRLNKARGHRLRATLHAQFTAGQSAFTRSVRLFK